MDLTSFFKVLHGEHTQGDETWQDFLERIICHGRRQKFVPVVIHHQKEKQRFEKILSFYGRLNEITNAQNTTYHTIISGGYPCYLERITKGYEDVDLFILCRCPIENELYDMSLKRRMTEYFEDQGCTISPIFEKLSYGFCKLVSMRIYVYYPDIDQEIDYNVVLTAVFDKYPGTQMEACQTLVDLFDMDLVSVCLTPTGYLVRLKNASFTTKLQLKGKKEVEEVCHRKLKYLSR